MKAKIIKTRQRAFTVAEVLSALVIVSIVLISALGVHSRIRRSSEQLEKKLENALLPIEILQRIAEDLDKLVSPAVDGRRDIQISIKNKFDQSYQAGQLKITQTYYDSRNKPQLFEEIIWQSNYDYDANSLVLYRSHKGLNYEDKILGARKEKWERELFIPVASGLTYFLAEASNGDKYSNSWTSKTMPIAVKISLSFEPPYEDFTGSLVIDEDDIITRTVTIDRTRNITFKYLPPDANDFIPDSYFYDQNEPGNADFTEPNNL